MRQNIKKNKTIKFNPASEESYHRADRPRPAREFLPEWYKKIPKFADGKFKPGDNNNSSNATLKACVPFMDGMTNGYIQETWCDIYIQKQDDSGLSYRPATDPKIMSHRGALHYPIGENFYQMEFVWQLQWMAQCPVGYSLLITHPINRYDLPFLTISAIVDSDSFYGAPDGANLPIYIKKDFEGIIPKGTPMYQMIPIKRESWDSAYNGYNKEQNEKFHDVKKVFFDGYKKLHWTKKSFK